MSLYIVYVPEGGDPVDGDQVATNSGWLAWGDWVLGRADDFPEAAHLAEEGDWWPDEGSDAGDLEAELRRLLEGGGPKDRLSVTARLLEAVGDRPDGVDSFLVTDGSPGGED